MEEILVTKSPDINQTDTIQYHENKTIFSLDDKNNTDGSLILIYMYLMPFPNFFFITSTNLTPSS